MKFDEYQEEAIKSIAIKGRGIDAISHRTLGLTGEAGVLGNRVKKIIRDSDGVPTNDDRDFAREKLGDVLYYASALADYFGLTLTDVAEGNLEKSSRFRETTKEQRQSER